MKINKPALIRRLTDRFGIEPGVIAPYMNLLPMVVLVSNADELLAEAKIGYEAKNLTAAAGTFTSYFEVPTGKRWRLLHIWKASTAGGSIFKIKERGGTARAWDAGLTADKIWELQGVKVDEGAQLGLDTTGNGGDTGIVMVLFYEEEDAF